METKREHFDRKTLYFPNIGRLRGKLQVKPGQRHRTESLRTHPQSTEDIVYQTFCSPSLLSGVLPDYPWPFIFLTYSTAMSLLNFLETRTLCNAALTWGAVSTQGHTRLWRDHAIKYHPLSFEFDCVIFLAKRNLQSTSSYLEVNIFFFIVNFSGNGDNKILHNRRVQLNTSIFPGVCRNIGPQQMPLFKMC